MVTKFLILVCVMVVKWSLAITGSWINIMN